MKTKVWISLVLAAAIIYVSGCGKKETDSEEPEAEPETKEALQMSTQKESFGQTPDGRQVELYTLTNTNGLRARITNYGALLVSLEVPDKDGNLADITLGYDTLGEYIKETPYFGATVGRYANRIGKARFVLNGVE